MTQILFVAAVLVVIALFWAARSGTSRPRALSQQQVVSALANALDLDGTGTHDEFDLFVARPISDPHFESLRAEILAIAQTDGQPIPGRDFGPKAEAWLRQTYEALKIGLPERVHGT